MANRSDNFNRADSTTALGTPSDGGSDWVAASGTWGITSNKSYKVGSGSTFEAAYLEASTSSADVQATNTGLGSTGLCCRLSNNSNFIFGQVISGTAYIWKRVAGTFTQIGSTYTGTIVAGDVWKLTCDASNNLKLYQNGVQRVSGTDAAGSTNTKHGFCDFSGGSSVNWDNFSITDTAGGGANFLTLSASSAASAAIAKAATSSKSATTTESATITRSVRLTRDATTTGTVTITKITAAIRLATATTAATLATIKAKLLTLTASVTNSATVRRAIGATRVATTTAAGTLARAISTTKAALTTASGTIGKVVATTKAAATASMATVATVKAKLLTLAASLSVSGAITKTIKITRSGAVSLLALLERLFISGGGGPAEIFAALTSKRSERNSDTSARPKAQAQRRPKQ